MAQYISITKSYEDKTITIQDLYSLYGGSRALFGVLLLVNESEIFIDEENNAPQSQSLWVYPPTELIVHRFDLFRLPASTIGSTADGVFYYDTDANDWRKNVEGVATTFTGEELWAVRNDPSAIGSGGWLGDAESLYTPNDIPLYHEIKTMRKTWLSTDCEGDDSTLIKHEKAIIAVDAHFNDGNYDRVEKILEFYNDN